MNFFRYHTPKFHAAKLEEEKQKTIPLLEIATIAAMLGVDVERIRFLLENGGEIHGWQTVEHGIWHDDPLGELEVNGRKGYYTYEILAKDKENLLTNGGRDFFHNQVYTNTSAGTRGGNFIAVSSNTGGASASHTAVAGEITTGGLARADADTKSHTNGTNVSTVEHTYTATAVHTDVQLSGLFNASSVGTLTHENTFTAVTLQINDTLKVTWTLTLG